MNNQGKDAYIKSKVASSNATVTPTTKKATEDAISGKFDPPSSERGGNSALGATIGMFLGGPAGLLIGGGIGASVESNESKEYKEVYKKTTELLEKTK